MDEETKKIELLYIGKALGEFFKDEPRLITWWLFESNPNFGGVSPAQLMFLRGGAGIDKVYKFVKDAREGNEYVQKENKST